VIPYLVCESVEDMVMLLWNDDRMRPDASREDGRLEEPVPKVRRMLMATMQRDQLRRIPCLITI
jgi:hypothetical protein